MCGIVVLQGPNANQRLPACLQRIRHRGPDDCQHYQHQDIAFGFVHFTDIIKAICQITLPLGIVGFKRC